MDPPSELTPKGIDQTSPEGRPKSNEVTVTINKSDEIYKFVQNGFSGHMVEFPGVSFGEKSPIKDLDVKLESYGSYFDLESSINLSLFFPQKDISSLGHEGAMDKYGQEILRRFKDSEVEMIDDDIYIGSR